MNEPIDSSQPIDVYFQKIDECIQYAVDARVAFMPDQRIQTAYHAASTSGYYNGACKEWHKKTPPNKTWTNFKQFFAAEYHNFKEQQKVNTSQSNFHGDNSAFNLSKALDNLALAATMDRGIVAQLTSTNQQLTATNKLLTEQLQKATKTNAFLVKTLGTEATNPPRDENNWQQPFNQMEWEAKLDPHGYCWSHGYCVKVANANLVDIKTL